MAAVSSKPGDRVDILFFSRGRGRGHALVDIAIAEQLRLLAAQLDLRFVSYGTGLSELVESWDGAFDLDISEDEPTIETLIRATHVIARFQPVLVVAHEEPAALPAARICGKPAVFITDWFLDSRDFDMTLLEYANQVLFLDQERVWEEPDSAAGRVQYYPPVLRSLTYSASDRARARSELGFGGDEAIVSVFIHPGRRSEEVTPIFDLLYPAFRELAAPEKRLIWLTDDDPVLSEKTRGLDDVEIRGPDRQPFDQLMAATDVGITKGNRNIVFELSALGVPSVSFTDQWNAIDDFRTARIPTNTTLRIDQVRPKQVQWELESALTARPALQAKCPPWVDGRSAVAERLVEIVEGLKELSAAGAKAG